MQTTRKLPIIKLIVLAKCVTVLQQPKVGDSVIDYCLAVLKMPFLIHIWTFFNNNKLSSIQEHKKYGVHESPVF